MEVQGMGKMKRYSSLPQTQPIPAEARPWNQIPPLRPKDSAEDHFPVTSGRSAAAEGSYLVKRRVRHPSPHPAHSGSRSLRYPLSPVLQTWLYDFLVPSHAD